MFNPVVNDLVVDLIGVQHQVMLTGNLDQLFQRFPGIHRTGGIVRVDYHQRPGSRRDGPLDGVDVRQPVGLFIAGVVDRPTTAERHRGSPQGIVGRRQQHLVTVVQQPLHRHDDQLADAIADVHVFDIDIGDTDLLAVLHDRLACRIQSFRLAVPLRVRQVVDHIDQNLFRRLEPEWRWVADIELDDPMAFFLQAMSFAQHRTADFVTDLIQLARLVDRRAPGRGQPGDSVRGFRDVVGTLH